VKNLILTKENRVALLKLNRAEVRNALDRETYQEFGMAMEEIKNDTQVRVLVITGEGKSFCAGLDLTFAATIKDYSPLQLSSFIKYLQNIFTFESIDKPVISAVNGYAVGNGCDIALASDIIIASEQAKFSMAYTNLGLIPDIGGTFRLSRLVGPAIAKEMILTGDMIDAKRAFDIGMVNRVVPADKLMEEAMAMAQKLAKRPPIALALAKKAVNNGLNADLASSLDLEIALQNICIRSKDLTEALLSAIEKREANYTGT
jgi:enoyl-CoA hydratase